MSRADRPRRRLARRRRHGRRTWPQRLVLATNVVAIFTTLAIAGGLTYFNHRFSKVERIQFGRDVLSEEVPAGDPQNYLIVGSDSDEGLDPGDAAAVGRGSVGGARSDSIMILRIDPAETNARILSFPRDLWVDIAGTGRKNKINSAYELGPDTLLLTIQQNFGIEIHHYIEINFRGFKELVKAIDGVPIYFPEKARDVNRKGEGSGFKTEAGCYTLDPGTALAFSRSRNYQVWRDGEWEVDIESDLGRIKRQQFFIEQALQRAVAKGARNPGTLNRLIDVGVMNVKIDSNLSTGDLVTLGRRFKDFNPKSLEKYSIPAVRAFHGRADALDMLVSEAEPTLNLFRGIDPGTVTPQGVLVQVLNASETEGLAQTATDDLAALGFVAKDPTDEEPMARTVVRFAASRSEHAQLVARHLDVPVTFEEVDGLAFDVVVVAGSNFTGVRTEPKAKSSVIEPPSTASTTTTTEPEGPKPPDFVPEEPPDGMDCP